MTTVSRHFQVSFLTEDGSILIGISKKFVPKSPIDNKSLFVNWTFRNKLLVESTLFQDNSRRQAIT